MIKMEKNKLANHLFNIHYKEGYEGTITSIQATVSQNFREEVVYSVEFVVRAKASTPDQARKIVHLRREERLALKTVEEILEDKDED